jgi:phage terminase small subunit
MAKDKLTDKQEMFCREYLVDLNATQAAIRAGYSEKTAKVIGAQNLSKLNVSERIDKLKEKRQNKVEVSAEYVLQTILDTVELSKRDDDKQNIYKGAELLGKHLSLFSDKILNQQLDKDGNPTDAPAIEVKLVKPNNTDNDT